MQWNEFRSHIGHLSARQQQRVHEAFELGKKMHKGQLRKSGEPYFSHPVAVADKLADMGADPDTIIAALLHDTVEDTALTVRDIDTAFNGTVGGLIDGVTKLMATDIIERPNMNEQIETLRKMFTLMEKDVRIMVIKLVDRLHNMQTAEFLPSERQTALAQETFDVYVKIADRLCMKDIRDELEGLALSILEPELFGKLSALLGQTESFSEDVLKLMLRKLKEGHARALSDMEVHAERKTWGNLREQLRSEGATVTGVSAVTVGFTCRDIDHCYRTLGIIHQLWKREILSFQDFINVPAINGYRGIHTTILLEDGTRVRCKIRTEDMNAYARKGIALHCFTGKPFSLMEHFPWAERISPLAQDTQGRSAEFWQSLQSDILGESIVIYGPADQSVLVPKGATALDGAFYLFRDEALHISSISIGGKQVSFSTALQHTHSLNVTVEEKPTVSREWVKWTTTGFATAMIRTALGKGSSEMEKMSLGKELLQQTLSQQHKGYIEELGEEPVRRGLMMLGYPTMESLYVAIADGRMEPAEAYRALLEPDRKLLQDDRRPFRLSYAIDTTNTDIMDRIGVVHRKFRDGLSEIRYLRSPDPRRGKVILKGALTPAEQQALTSDISAAGGERLMSLSLFSKLNIVLGIGILVALWGLDPVFARMLLDSGIPPIDLTIIRLLTVWCIAAVLFAGQRLFSGRQLKRLDPLHPDLLLCGFLLFLTGLSTYLTLDYIFPTQYILFIIGGVLVTALIRHRTTLQSALSLLVTGGVLVALGFLQGWSATGFFFATVSSAGFALYSALSKRYQEEKALIRTRYPAFLFWVSTAGLLLAGLLLPYARLDILSVPAIAQVVLFSTIFITLPYVLYFEFMRRVNALWLDRALPFVCLATMLGEAVSSRSWIPLAGLVLPALFLAMYGRKAIRPATLPL